MHTLAVYFIATSAVVTFVLELWTGCAVAGWTGDRAIVRRDKSRGPYWFVMVLQAAVLCLAFMIATAE